MKTLISLLFITVFFAVAITQSPKKENKVSIHSETYTLDYSKAELKAPSKELIAEANKLKSNVKKLEEQVKTIAYQKPDSVYIDSSYVIATKKKSWIKRTIEKVF
jgi:hypothetical protein